MAKTADTPSWCCTPLSRATLSAPDAVALSAVLKALADPARLRLLSLVQAANGGEACACNLVDALAPLSQPTISHHLSVLVRAGLLTRDKRGVWAYYRAVPSALAALSDVLAPAVVA